MHGAMCHRALAQPLPLLRCHGRARQTRGSSACAWGGRAGHGQRFPLLAVAHLSWLPAPPPRLWAPHRGLRAARAGVSASPQPPPRSLLQAGAASAAPWEAVCTRELCVFILFLFCLISALLGAPRSAGTSLRRLLLLEPLSPARWAARGAAAPSPQSAGGEIRLCSGARGHHSLGEKHTEVLPASSSTSLGRGGGTRGAWGAQGRMGSVQWWCFNLGKPPRSSSSRWPRGFTCGPGVHQAAEDGRGGSPTEKTTTGNTTSGNTTTISRAGLSAWLLLLPWGATGIRQAQISLRAPDAGHRRQPRDGQERNSSRTSAAGARGCPRRAGADHPAGAHQWFPTPRGGHAP